MSVWTWIVALGVGTLLIRASFLVGSGDRQPSPYLGRILALVPAAVLSALVTPALFLEAGHLDLHWQNERLVAGVVAGLVAWRTRNVSATLVAGMLVLWGTKALLGRMGM